MTAGSAPSAGTILELIRQTGGLSRAELLERSGMARSTLYARLEELAALGVIYEAEPLEAGRGRPSRRIRFDDRGRVVLAVAIGQAIARVSVTDVSGRELRSRTRPVELSRPAAEVLDPLLDIGAVLLAPGDVLAGVGVAVPAPVDVRTGLIRAATTIADWPADAALTAAGRRFGVPVVVENDGRAEALGECAPGETMVYAKVATGISCGIVVDGQVVGGARGVAGDIGHILVDPAGPRCRCGRRGCLAAFSSGAGLVERLGLGSLDELVAAVGDGAPTALAELRAAAGHLGRALAAIVATVNPGRLLLGGAVGRLRPMVDEVRARVQGDVVERVADGLRVEAGAWGEAAAARGLADLVVRRAYSPEAIDGLLRG
ncbi:MAG TPA: ROK family transcriptional regulator [Pseudonocardia sp.]|jgi:predicted NBD/HSP70 family sugar kinase|uniref:ROK family transcriptional regulator n=1 Tax=Pseudonocardia sp. TaxID=60912 RepID=UPI002B4AF31F|nr:ROK family transcriptional regulator [Pseudonocardia sp.]HLU60102.1 ROK family transcriptional regulator [Pseudonocardia sp.]